MTPEEKAKNREQLKAKLRDKIHNKSISLVRLKRTEKKSWKKVWQKWALINRNLWNH